MSVFRSKLARYGTTCCEQIMPVPVVPVTTLKRPHPQPIYPLPLPFTPPEPTPCPPSIVPIEVGEYPSDKIVRLGDILANNTGVLPSGFLWCDGSEVSRTTYADLFRIIGTYYGEGNGSTTFNLPLLINDSRPTLQYMIQYTITPSGCCGGGGGGGGVTSAVQILPFPQQFTPPPGTILHNTLSTLPHGYLDCDGSAVSRITYGVLFNIIGTYYGQGDGSTTFTLPNLSVVAGQPYKYIIRYMVPEELFTVQLKPVLEMSGVKVVDDNGFCVSGDGAVTINSVSY